MMKLKCETCIPHLDCDFFAVDIEDAVLEELMIACPEEMRLAAIDVQDAAISLRGVDLGDRVAVEAALAGLFVDSHGQRRPGFIERAIRCAALHRS
jgi:hypothetical protein